MSLDDVATLNLSTATQSITRAGFGIPAICTPRGPAALALTPVTAYADDAAMAADGWPAMHPARIKAAAMFAQETSPPLVKVITLGDTTTSMTIRLTPAFIPAEGKTVRLVIKRAQAAAADEINYTILPAATIASVLTALAALIDALADVTCVATPTYLTVVSVAGYHVYVDIDQYTNPGMWTFEDMTTAYGSISTALDNAKAMDDDWHGLTCTHTSKTEILAIETWAETNHKLFIPQSADSDVTQAVATDVASVAQLASLARTAVHHHPVHSDVWAAGQLGSRSTSDPGVEHWVYKQVSGSIAPVYSASQIVQLKAKNVNYMVRTNNKTASRGGKVAAGEWIDIVRLADFFRARIPEDLYEQQLNSPVIKYTLRGIDAIASVIKGRLDSKIGEGIAGDPSPTVTTPDINSILSASKNARVLPNVKFKATLDGAILMTEISGQLVP